MRHQRKRSYRRRSAQNQASTTTVAPSSVDRRFEEALEFHRRGALSEAAELYQQILAEIPTHSNALHMLGFAAFQSRQFAEAAKLIRLALAQDPNNGEFHANLGLALLCCGDSDAAREHLSEARKSGWAEPASLVHIGFELYREHKLEAAQVSLSVALELAPQLPEAHHFLGLVHKQAGRVQQAMSCYHAAIQYRPDYADALVNLGNALRDDHRCEEAFPYYRAAIAAAPQMAAAYNNLGVAQTNVGQLEQAIESFEQALLIDADSADAHNNLGNALRDLGRLTQAEHHFRQAHRLAPSSAEVLNNFGTMLLTDGRPEQAIEQFRKSLSIDPNRAKVITNLGAALLEIGEYGAARQEMERIPPLVETKDLARLRAGQICPTVFPDADSMERRWDEITALVDECRNAAVPSDLGELPYEASAAPFNLQFFKHNICDIKRAYARVFERLQSLGPASERAGRRSGIYRIGMVVTNSHEGIFLKSLRGVLERIDGQQFDIQILCSQSGLERLRRDLGGSAVEVRPIPGRLDQAAKAIVDANLDLLYYFEIGTHATNYFLPFFRLAPVQCTSWGIQVTSGIPTIDYYLSSRLVEPTNAADHYSEKLELANALLCYRHRAQYPGPTSREAFGLEQAGTIFLCAQQPGKFHPDFDSTLRSILLGTEKSILVLTADKHGHAARSLQARFQKTMPEVVDRVRFLPRLDSVEYRSLILASDVLLDPPYFVGVNSTYDGLSLGKPIVTCPSEHHRGRYTYGCYRQMGLDSCIAEDTDSYVELACHLGQDVDLRREASQQIDEQSHLLFEDPRAVSEHERLFAEIIERHTRD